MDFLLSVIVPCYNKGKYIKRCLESILRQTYNNIEVIAVDDGSVDNTRDLISEIAKNDSRVLYYYKENSGVSDTRNFGLKAAKGDYVTFVDADDEIAPDMYEVLINNAKKSNADISHCSYCRVENGIKKQIGNTGEKHEFENTDVLSSLLRANLFTGSTCTKIYKRSILSGIFFDRNIRFNEDVLFNYFAFKNAGKAVFQDLCLYYYHIETESSSCINAERIKVAEDCFTVSKIMLNDNDKPEVDSLLRKREFNTKVLLYRAYIFEGNKEQKEKAKILRREIIRESKSVEQCRNERIDIFMMKYLSLLYKPFYSLYNRIRKPNWDI